SPTQFTPLINPFNPVSTPPSIPLKKPLILPVTDLITSPILFMTPVTLFFIPVTNPTVLFLIPFHFLDMKPPTEFIVLRVPLDKEPQAPLTPDQVFLALFTVLDLILDHFELINLPTEFIVARVFLFKFDHQFFTPDHVDLALFTVPDLIDCHFLDIKLPTEFIVYLVFLFRLDHQPFTSVFVSFALLTVPSFMDCHFLDIKLSIEFIVARVFLPKFDHQAFTPDHNNFAFPTVLSLIDVHFLDIQLPNVEKITLLTLAKFENVPFIFVPIIIANLTICPTNEAWKIPLITLINPLNICCTPDHIFLKLPVNKPEKTLAIPSTIFKEPLTILRTPLNVFEKMPLIKGILFLIIEVIETTTDIILVCTDCHTDITIFLKVAFVLHKCVIPATNNPMAVITIPIGPVINLIAKPNPRVANAAALVTPVQIVMAVAAIFDLIACIV